MPVLFFANRSESCEVLHCYNWCTSFTKNRRKIPGFPAGQMREDIYWVCGAYYHQYNWTATLNYSTVFCATWYFVSSW